MNQKIARLVSFARGAGTALHHSLSVRRVDWAAFNHVALLTPTALLKLGLNRNTKVLDLKSRVRCRHAARGGALS
jgi:hypothetical protein